MNYLLYPLVAAFASVMHAAEVPRIDPRQAAQRVEVNKAVLIDVREPAEWKLTGTAAPALLLPKSDFDGMQELWKPVLKKYPPSSGITLILFCRWGGRADEVGAALAAQGYLVANAGGFSDWVEAGLPVRRIAEDWR